MKKRFAYALFLLMVVFAMGAALSSSAAPSAYVHGVFSEKPLYVLDGTTGSWLTSTSGNAIADRKSVV